MLVQDRRRATHKPWNSRWRRSRVTASHRQLEKEGMILSPLNLLLRCTALLFLGVSAPYHESSAICWFCFSLDRVQGLDLQLCRYGFNARFIEAKHLQKAFIRSHGSLQQSELSKELNRSTEHNTQESCRDEICIKLSIPILFLLLEW